MRQRLNIGRYPLACPNSPIRLRTSGKSGGSGGVVQLDGQQCETLANVIVKLSGDPRSLLILRINQPAAHVCERRFHLFALRDVRYHADNRIILPCFVEVRATGSLTQIISRRDVSCDG